jgi:23S rRNA (guanosine2251-2'-O)-methyltransferase
MFDPNKKREFLPKKPFVAHRADNMDMVFGLQTVLETIRAGKEIDKILVLRELGNIELMEFARLKGIPTQKVPKEKLDRITRKNHQGVIAFVSAINYCKMENVVAEIYEKGQVPLVLVLDRITDVRNFGAIARTAEVAGVQLIIIPTKGAAQINADALKTSSGALNFVPVARVERLDQAVEYLQNAGLKVVACTEKAKEDLYIQDFTGPLAMVLGSEEDGIGDDILRKVDAFATIPQMGRIGSLNVSVATGVVLFEALRQRQALQN